MRRFAPGRWAHLAPIVAPILLSGVALVQLHAARTTWLTPWKGGGFGMFSTVDSPGARFLRIVLETDNGSVRVGVPRQLLRDAQRLREAPDSQGLRDFAVALVAGTWVPQRPVSAEARYAALLAAASSLDGRTALPPGRAEPVAYRMLGDGEAASDRSLSLRQARVEVWRYRVDGKTTRLVANRLAGVQVAAAR